MRAGLLVSMLAGCELVFPLEDPGDGGGDPADCSSLFGGAATPLTTFEGSPDDFDPSFTGDPDELFLTTVDNGVKRIHTSRRTGATFSRPVVVELGAQQGTEDFDPALTEDGANLLFLSSRDAFVLEARRAPGAPTFGAPGILNLPQFIRGLDVTPDGLTVYFQDGDDNLAFAHRGNRTESFGGVTELDFLGSFPSISGDQRELYYRTDEGMIVRRRREDPDGVFGPEATIREGSDPEISPDGRTLIFAFDQSLFTLTRECP